MTWLLELFGLVPARNVRNTPPSAIALPVDESDLKVDGFDPGAKLSFAETIEHLNRGFEHSQRVAQFMDAKASGVIAFCLAVFAFIANVVAWVYGVSGSGCLTKWNEPSTWVHGVLALLVVWAAYHGGKCLYRAFSIIRPNGLPTQEGFTTLFPVREQAAKHEQAVAYLNRFVQGESRQFVIKEFNSQLLAMGGIIYFKIAELQKSITHLRIQGILAVIIGGVVGVSAGFGLIDCQKKEVAPAATAQVTTKAVPVPAGK